MFFTHPQTFKKSLFHRFFIKPTRVWKSNSDQVLRTGTTTDHCSGMIVIIPRDHCLIDILWFPIRYTIEIGNIESAIGGLVGE